MFVWVDEKKKKKKVFVGGEDGREVTLASFLYLLAALCLRLRDDKQCNAIGKQSVEISRRKDQEKEGSRRYRSEEEEEEEGSSESSFMLSFRNYSALVS